MKKLVNRIDHVQWICLPENAAGHVADLEAVTGASLLRVDRSDVGCIVYIDWSAGLEVIVPLAKRSLYNQRLYDWLDTRGEGLYGIAFGVADLDKSKAALEEKGIAIGPLFDNLPVAPWPQHLVVRERLAPSVINSNLILSQIDYAEGLIQLEDATENAIT